MAFDISDDGAPVFGEDGGLPSGFTLADGEDCPLPHALRAIATPAKQSCGQNLLEHRIVLLLFVELRNRVICAHVYPALSFGLFRHVVL